MNSTRYSWSKVYNCSLTREENVPVIAVSSFMLFLPLIFYLSNYLHSEQKKRKLMHRKFRSQLSSAVPAVEEIERCVSEQHYRSCSLSIRATSRNIREEVGIDQSVCSTLIPKPFLVRSLRKSNWNRNL